MSDFARDPYNNVIQSGIKDELQAAIGERRFRTALILFYSGIDAMTYLSLPSGRERAKGEDYAKWSEKYVLRGPLQQITGDELYGARCAMLHEYGLISDATTKRAGRMLGIQDFDSQIIRYDPAVSKDLMIVSLYHLIAAFCLGIDDFCVEAMTSPATSADFSRRLNWMLAQFPIKSAEPDKFAEYRTLEHAEKELRHKGW
jgi:hypothetical protein